MRLWRGLAGYQRAGSGCLLEEGAEGSRAGSRGLATGYRGADRESQRERWAARAAGTEAFYGLCLVGPATAIRTRCRAHLTKDPIKTHARDKRPEAGVWGWWARWAGPGAKDPRWRGGANETVQVRGYPRHARPRGDKVPGASAGMGLSRA